MHTFVLSALERVVKTEDIYAFFTECFIKYWEHNKALPEQWSSAYYGKKSTAKRFEVRWLRTLNQLYNYHKSKQIYNFEAKIADITSIMAKAVRGWTIIQASYRIGYACGLPDTNSWLSHSCIDHPLSGLLQALYYSIVCHSKVYVKCSYRMSHQCYRVGVVIVLLIGICALSLPLDRPCFQNQQGGDLQSPVPFLRPATDRVCEHNSGQCRISGR